MPKLAVLLTCDKMLLDDLSTPSFIGAFVALDVVPGPETKIERNAMNPRQWCICSMWTFEESELGRKYTQKVKMTLPNGDSFGEAAEEITPQKRSHTVKIVVPFIPVGIPGDLAIDVWLESDAKKIANVTRYTVSITHRDSGFLR